MSQHHRRVLLLEDTESDFLVMQEFLRGDVGVDNELRHVDHVAYIAKEMDRFQPDVVLLDLCVHDSEGIDTFRRVNQVVAGRCPMIVQSGMDDVDIAIAALREGAQDFIVKSSLTQDLISRSIRYAIERFRSERALRESEQRYALALQGANDVIWDWSIEDDRLTLSDRFGDLTKQDSPTYEAFTHLPDCIEPADQLLFEVALADHWAGLTPNLSVELRLKSNTVEPCWVLLRGIAVRDERDQVARMAGSMTDIRARRAYEERLRHEALHDELTGLANRTLLLDRVDLALRAITRLADRRVALLYVDLDRFKLVNDTMGHAAGDTLLCGVARRLTESVRPGDTVARLGGDEFCVLLPEINGPQSADIVARRILDSLRAPLVVDGREVVLGASIGVAVNSEEHQQPEQLLRAADLALYQAKRSGKACFRRFETAFEKEVHRRVDLEYGLRQALAAERLDLRFQPIVCLQTGTVDSVETLLRWNCPQRGAVSPMEFIELAEETGLIVPIGQWVFREAMTRMLEWERCYADAPRPRRLSVNVSVRQLHAGCLTEQVLEALEQTGFPAHRLAIEITESALCEDPEAARKQLEPLREMGVEVHLDDFGIGYSSLAYLQRLPIDCLKIDKSFVAAMSDNVDARQIVQAIVDLGHGLGKRVVAEGIETMEQLEQVKTLGCDYGQGFHFARPMVSLPRASEPFTLVAA